MALWLTAGCHASIYVESPFAGSLKIVFFNPWPLKITVNFQLPIVSCAIYCMHVRTCSTTTNTRPRDVNLLSSQARVGALMSSEGS